MGPAAGWPGGLGSGWSGAPGLTTPPAPITDDVWMYYDTFEGHLSQCTGMDLGLRRGIVSVALVYFCTAYEADVLVV